MNELTPTQPMSIVEAGAATAAISSSREMQEVQAAVFMAKTYPRDETASLRRIEQACSRPALAEKAIYSFPRGGSNVTGPSIRLAEAIAQSWGNIQSGFVELENKNGVSTVMTYAWDIETNTRDTKIFSVPHVRQTRNGSQALTDPRDIYEMVANQASRRKRACILAVIPKDIVDTAVSYCARTLSGGQKLPLIDRLRNMLKVFRDEFSVPQESIEKYMGYKLEAFTELDVQTLAGIYNAIKDGVKPREAYFELPKLEEPKEEKKPKKVKLSEV